MSNIPATAQPPKGLHQATPEDAKRRYRDNCLNADANEFTGSTEIASGADGRFMVTSSSVVGTSAALGDRSRVGPPREEIVRCVDPAVARSWSDDQTRSDDVAGGGHGDP